MNIEELMDQAEAGVDTPTEPVPSEPQSTTRKSIIELMDEAERPDPADVGVSMYAGKDLTPEIAGSVLKTSRQSGLDTSVVSRNLPEVQKQVESQKVDPDILGRDAPLTAKWIAEDPVRAAAARDDLDNLTAVEKEPARVGAIREVVQNLAAGFQRANASVGRLPSLLYGPQNLALSMVGLEEKATIPAWTRDNPFTRWADKEAKKLETPVVQEDFKKALETKDTKHITRWLANQVAYNAPNTAVAIAAYIMSRGAGTGLAAVGSLATSQAQETALQAGADPATAFADALTQGTFEAAGEAYGSFGLLGKWSNQIARTVGKDAAREILKDLGKTLSHSIVTEGASEAATDIAQGATDYFYGLNPNWTPSEALWSAAGAGLIGAASGGSMIAPSAIGMGVTRGIQARQATSARESFMKMAEAAEKSALRARDPESHTELMERQLEGTTHETIGIPANEFKRLMQEANLDPYQVAEEMGALQSLKDADTLDPSGKAAPDVEISTAKFLGRFVGTPVLKSASDHVRWNQREMTMAEVKRLAQEEIKKTEQFRTEDEEILDQEIRAREDQLAAAGRTPEDIQASMDLYRAMIKTEMAKMGQTAAQVLDRLKMTVSSEYETLNEKIERKRPAQEVDRATWEAATPQERLAMAYIAPVTGTLNAAAFREINKKPPADRPLVAHVSVPGVKYVNDMPGRGHEAGDDLYRYAANALREQVPDVAFDAGDFVFHVANQAELDRVLTAANASLPETMRLGNKTVTGRAAFQMTGAVAEKPGEAARAHGEIKKRLEQEGRRAPRGQAPIGFAETKEKAPAAPRKASAVPKDLAAQYTKMSPDIAHFATTHDHLTGLLNYDAYLRLRDQYQAKVSLDLNLFDQINQKYGRPVGDDALIHFSKAINRLASDLNQEDAPEIVLFRKSGDEFLALCDDPELVKSFLFSVEENLRYNLFRAKDDEVQLSFSAGIGGNDGTAERALKDAKHQAWTGRKAKGISGLVEVEVRGSRSATQPSPEQAGDVGQGSGEIATVRPEERGVRRYVLGDSVVSSRFQPGRETSGYGPGVQDVSRGEHGAVLHRTRTAKDAGAAFNASPIGFLRKAGLKLLIEKPKNLIEGRYSRTLADHKAAVKFARSIGVPVAEKPGPGVIRTSQAVELLYQAWTEGGLHDDPFFTYLKENSGGLPQDAAFDDFMAYLERFRSGPRGTATEYIEAGHADGNLAQKLGGHKNLMQQSAQASEDEGPRLSTIHNLSEENIKYAERSGGLPVPSIAVVPQGQAMTNMGEITLIGDRSLADPANVPVYDSDAYSPTYPEPEYHKVRQSVAEKVLAEFQTIAREFEDHSSIRGIQQDAVEHGRAQSAMSKALGSDTIKVKFLRDIGININPIMQKKKPYAVFSHAPAWRKFVSDLGDNSDISYDDDVMMKRAGHAIKEALIEKSKRKYPELSQEDRDDLIIEPAIKMYLDEDGERATYGRLHRMIASAREYGQTEVSTHKTWLAINRAMKGHEVEFQSWVESKIMPMFGEPFLTIGRKHYPYNLENIAEAMKGSVKATQDTIVFGEGKARAAAAHKITSITEMRNRAAWQIKPEESITKDREIAKKLMEEYRGEAIKYYRGMVSLSYGTSIDTFAALDESMRVLSKWATGSRTPERLRSLLNAGYFDTAKMPNSVIKLGVRAGTAMMEASVPYFEAKPQRIVRLEEFKGAVIPDNASDETRQILEKNNIPYKTYKHKNPEARLSAVNRFRDDLQRRGLDVYFQSAAKKGDDPWMKRPRAMTEFLGYETRVILTKGADQSSMPHELMHVWMNQVVASDFETLKGMDPATISPLQKRYLGDCETILQWVGAKSFREMNTKQQEALAHAWEKYLGEGKAPNASLKRAFDAFKNWIVQIYQSLNAKYFSAPTGKNLDDTLRAVFGRILEVDAQVSQAEEARTGLQGPLFTDPAAAGMSPEKAAKYNDLKNAGHTGAADEVAKAEAARVAERNNPKWQEIRKRLTEEAKAEVDQDPVYMAINGMREKNIRIDARMIPEDMRDSMPTGTVADEGGVIPEAIADAFDFASGQEVLERLADALPEEQVVADLVNERLKELDPDLFGEPVDVAPAMNAIHRNVATEKRLWMELEHLTSPDLTREGGALKPPAENYTPPPPARRLGVETADDAESMTRSEEERLLAPGTMKLPSEAQLKDQVKRIIGRYKIRYLNPERFLKVESYAAGEAGRLTALGDKPGAYRAKLTELLNHLCYREVLDAQERMREGLVLFNQFRGSDKTLTKTRDIAYLNAGRAILSTYGYGPETALTAAEYLRPVKEYDPDPEVYNHMVSLVEDATANAMPWKKMTVDRFDDLVRAVGAMWAQAREVRQIEVKGVKHDMAKVTDELSTAIQIITKPDTKPYVETPGKWETFKTGLLGLAASLRRMESWCEEVDQGEYGPFDRYAFRQIKTDSEAYRGEKAKLEKAILAIFKTIPDAFIEKPIEAHELLNPESKFQRFRSKAELLGSLLHTGNKSNLQKLLRGYGWAQYRADGELDTTNWDLFIKRCWAEKILTEDDYKAVQAIWDLFEALKPAAQRAHKAIYGYYFNEITAEPVNTQWGQFRGGYVPAIVDSRVDATASSRAEKSAAESTNNSYMFPTAGTHGFTKSRIEAYAAPLVIDLNLFRKALDKQLKFSHIVPHAREVSRLFWQKGFRAVMDKYDPAIVSDMIIPWLNRAAHQRNEESEPGKGAKLIERASHYIRTSVGANIMFGHVINTLQNIGNLAAVTEVGGKHLVKGLWTYITHPNDTAQEVCRLSQYMANKMDTDIPKVTRAIEHITEPGVLKDAQRWAKANVYLLQGLTQNVMDYATWWGAYEKSMEVTNGDLEESVARADKAVRMTQGAFAPEDLSSMETGRPIYRLFTMFTGWFNMQLNLIKTKGTRAIREGDNAMGLSVIFWTWLATAYVSKAISLAFSGRVFDWGDDDDYLEDILCFMFLTPFEHLGAMVPVLGPTAVGMIRRSLAVAGFAVDSSTYDERVSLSPALSLAEAGIRLSYNLAKGSEANKKMLIKDVLTLTGTATKLPLAPLGKPIGYAIDVATGKKTPRGENVAAQSADYLRGLATGR